MPSQGQCPGEVLRRSKGCQRPRASHDAPIAASGTDDVTCFDTCFDLDGAKPACAYCLAGSPNTVAADDEKMDARFGRSSRLGLTVHGQPVAVSPGAAAGARKVFKVYGGGAGGRRLDGGEILRRYLGNESR